MQYRIAVIGSGIAGLTSAYLLSKYHDVTLFEANDYLGGHTCTIPVEVNGNTYAIDTGFIVFNQKTYPNFCRLLVEHQVPIQPTEMSFSYRSDIHRIEYNGNSLNTLFSNRQNLYNVQFYRLIGQILKFNRDAKAHLAHQNHANMSMGEFIEAHRYSHEFVSYYLVPMMAAIWSKNKAQTLTCDASFILSFYANHGLLNLINRPQWYVIQNGSNSYIPSLITSVKNKIYLNTKIDYVERYLNKVVLKSKKNEYAFDKVFIATHSDQALQMLALPSTAERKILSSIKYTNNEVTLHTDTALMPKKKLAWASWNYFDNGSETSTLTYYMNRLQSIRSSSSFFVSMNLKDHISDRSVIKTFSYAHPCLDQEALIAQRNLNLINGHNHTYYVGSYWGHGFHEDGVNSAIRSCQLLEAAYV